jgi:hypothetical protein
LGNMVNHLTSGLHLQAVINFQTYDLPLFAHGSHSSSAVFNAKRNYDYFRGSGRFPHSPLNSG